MSRYESAEVGEDPQPELLALFGMELAREEVIGRDARNKRITVFGRRGDRRIILRDDIKRMHKVNRIPSGNAFQKRRFFLFLNLIPAHVRYLETVVRVESHDFAGKQVQAFLYAEFFALREKQLKPETDTEEGFFPSHNIADRFD